LRLAPDIVFSIQIEEGNLLALCKPWVTLYKLQRFVMNIQIKLGPTQKPSI